MTAEPSAAIAAIDYDPARHILTVRFANGHSRIHVGVPGAIADAFRAAQQTSDFYASHIRDVYRLVT